MSNKCSQTSRLDQSNLHASMPKLGTPSASWREGCEALRSKILKIGNWRNIHLKTMKLARNVFRNFEKAIFYKHILFLTFLFRFLCERRRQSTLFSSVERCTSRSRNMHSKEEFLSMIGVDTTEILIHTRPAQPTGSLSFRSRYGLL